MLYKYVTPERYMDRPLVPDCNENHEHPALPTHEELIAKAMKIFRIVAQEFSFVPDEDEEGSESETVYGLRTYMELFCDQISLRQFGRTYSKALAYLTAHKMKMMGLEATLTDESGNTISEDEEGLGTMAIAMRLSSASEGETSVSFRAPATSGDGSSSVDGDYELTVYGIEFLKLRKNAVVGIISSGEPVFKNGRRL